MRQTPRLKIIRRALDLTQKEFAARFQIPLGTLRGWNRAPRNRTRRPSLPLHHRRRSGCRASRPARDAAIRLTARHAASTPPMLETASRFAYTPAVPDRPKSAPPPAGWEESLARSKAQIAAGQSVPLLPILDRLRASAERLEAELCVTADGVGINPKSGLECRR